MKITIHKPLAIYEIGQRSNQEDALWPLQGSADNQLFIVCDGMGGHEKGEVASQTVSQSLGEWFASHNFTSLTDDQLKEALEYAYTQLDQKDNGELKKMGTTLTLIYMGSQGVTAAHIGDSRIYHIRPGVGVLYQSRDHSLVFDLFQTGEISYEEMATHPQKNIITRAVTPGKENRTRPDIIHITDVKPGDYFYLCSDGMLEQMDNDELVSLLTSNVSNEEKCQQLINATSQNKDNHSAWLVQIKDVVKEAGDENLANEEPTARCNAINLMPKKIQEVEETIEEAELAEEDDVQVEADVPKRFTKKKSVWVKLVAIVIALLAALFTVWYFFLNDNEEGTSKYYEQYIETKD